MITRCSRGHRYSDYTYQSCPRCKINENPSAGKTKRPRNPEELPRTTMMVNGRRMTGVVIYDRVYALEAQKGPDSHFAKENFRHDFTDKETMALGLEDGSILLVNGNGKRLWKEFDYD